MFWDQILKQVSPTFLAISVYLLAFLMVSNLKYPTFKKFGIKKRVPFARFLFVVLTLYIFATIPRLTLCFISITYVLLGPLEFIVSLFKKKPVPEASSKSNNHPEKLWPKITRNIDVFHPTQAFFQVFSGQGLTDFKNW